MKRLFTVTYILLALTSFEEYKLRKMLPIDTLFLHKSYLYKSRESYAQENEWRMICRCPAKESNDYACIPDRKCVKAIYYGPDIEERYKSHLRRWLSYEDWRSTMFR